MKSVFHLMLFMALLFFSCKKEHCDPVNTSIDGTWKMVSVKDHSTNRIMTKPSSINGDVILTFISNSATAGTFTGKTPSNDIWVNNYTTGSNYEMSIPVLSMTKVAETSWGLQLVDHIIEAQRYYFTDGGKLNIITTKRTLTFKRQ